MNLNSTNPTQRITPMIKHLTKRGEALYGFAAFGPNLMNIFLSAYVLNAFILPAGLDWYQRMVWTFSGVALVHTLTFGLVSALVRIIDGVIDFPLATALQNMHSKYGRHRVGIVLGFIPMVIAFMALLFPLFLNPDGTGQQIGQTIYIAFVLLVFYIGYTMTLVTYYSSYAEITGSAASRVRLGSWKSVWDTIGFSIGYALVPVLVGVFTAPALNIGMSPVILTTLVFTPTFFTMLIPLFMIKSDRGSNTLKLFGSRKDAILDEEPPETEIHASSIVNPISDEAVLAEVMAQIEQPEYTGELAAVVTGDELKYKAHKKYALTKEPAEKLKDIPKETKERQTLKSSLQTAFKDKDFRAYLWVLMAMNFGLQLFLATQHIYAISVLGLNAWQIAVINACAFGFVPLTIWIFNKVLKKKGIGFAVKMCLVSFFLCVAIFSLSIFTRNSGFLPNILIGIVASLFASYPIAVFFAITYIIPSQIGVRHLKKSGRNTSGTLFAAQGLAITIVSAISVNLIWIIGLSGATLVPNTYGFNMYTGARGLTENIRYFWVVCQETGIGSFINSQYVMQRTGEYFYGYRMSQGVYEYGRIWEYRYRYVFHSFYEAGQSLSIYSGGSNNLDLHARVYDGQVLIRQGFIQERGLFGSMFIMPIVALSMVVAFFFALKLPKRYSTDTVAVDAANTDDASADIENSEVLENATPEPQPDSFNE